MKTLPFFRALSISRMMVLVVGAACLFDPQTLHSRTAATTQDNCPLSILRLKLVRPGSGWVIFGAAGGDDCVAQRIYWTDDNGQSWRNITPDHMPTRAIGMVFFLDRLRGWMLSTNSLADEQNPAFYLLSTQDGGRHWGRTVLRASMFGLIEDYDRPVQLIFSDPRHGWMIWHWGIMNSYKYVLLATNDGGRTWKQIGEEIPGEAAQFLSSRDGWTIGGPADCDGIGCPQDAALWVTRDGGARWKPVGMCAPPKSIEQPMHILGFRFANMLEGVAVAQEQIDDRGRLFRFFTCRTHDGGKSWRTSHFDAYYAAPRFLGKHILWQVSNLGITGSRANNYVQIDDGPRRLQLPMAAIPAARFVDLSFCDALNAWASFTDGEHAGLVVTIDGGKSWRRMSLPENGEPLKLH